MGKPWAVYSHASDPARWVAVRNSLSNSISHCKGITMVTPTPHVIIHHISPEDLCELDRLFMMLDRSHDGLTIRRLRPLWLQLLIASQPQS